MKSLEEKGYTLNLVKHIPDDIIRVSQKNKDFLINTYKKFVFIDVDDYKKFGKKYYDMNDEFENTHIIDEDCGIRYTSTPMFHLYKSANSISLYKNYGFAFALNDEKKFLCAKIKGLESTLEMTCEEIYNDETIYVMNDPKQFSDLMQND